MKALLAAVVLVLSLGTLAAALRTPSEQNPQPAKVMGQLLSGAGGTMISQPVALSNVTVQNLTQDDIVWVGASPNHSVLVMLQPSVNPMDVRGNPTPIAAGDHVRITGHVLRAPGTQVLRGWGVSAVDAARVQHQGVVVQAVELVVTKENK